MKPLIIITGPTAVGKSALSISVAQALNGEIISADSMQVYKGMDIGTDKIKPAKTDGVPHHMIDILEPTQDYNVHDFAKRAKEIIDEIYSRGRLPIIVGGTGFYIQALLYDINFTEDDNDGNYRKELEALAKEDDGPVKLHRMLTEIDPESAENIHYNNVKRTIRALEYYKLTGQKISEHNADQRQKESPYAFLYFVLNDDRSKLYERIEERIDEMLEDNLVAEVEGLLQSGCKRDMTSMQGIGYKQVAAYLEGEYDYEEMVRVLKRDTRHFAKRQITWFKRERDCIWLSREEYANDEIRQMIIDQSKELLNNNPIGEKDGQ